MRIGVSSEQGMRPFMEDAHVIRRDLNQAGDVFLGVFDGHSGSRASEYAAEFLPGRFNAALKEGLGPEQALERAYQEISRELDEEVSGTTAVTCYLRDDMITVANAGDTRALVVSRDWVRQLTRDHRVEDPEERARILAQGGEINGSYVVFGGAGLMPTRSLGDAWFELAGVTPVPDVSTERIGPGDQWLIAACDGLFDFMDNQTAANLVRGASSPQEAASLLSQEVLITRMGTDNLTIIVLELE